MQVRSLSLSRASSARRPDRWQEGQPIKINRGALSGLSGILVRRTGGSRWIVRVDGLPHGVVLAIDAVALTERRTEPAIACRPPAPMRERRHT